VNITNAAGSITLSTPQDINSTASPTFNQFTLNNAASTSSHAVRADRTIMLTSETNVTVTANSGVGQALTSNIAWTFGWAGQLSLARGGTNTNLSVVAGSVAYGTATGISLNSAGTSGQALISGGAAAPTWWAPATPTNALVFLDVNSALQKGALTWNDSGKALGLAGTTTGTLTQGNGNMTIDSGNNAGTITLFAAPSGASIIPGAANGVSLGMPSKKFLTVYASELNVETLVAQDTMATLGGRVLIAPTTSLTSDLTAVATTIYVKHNNLALGDIIIMEGAMNVEYMAIASVPSGTGPYSYTITRNLDGTGANAWSIGDAVVNTGGAGSGFIDMFSLWGVSGLPLAYIYNANYNGGSPQFLSNYSMLKSMPIFGDNANNEINDAVYFGQPTNVWSNLYMTLSAAGVYSATMQWEFWNGGAWVLFSPTINGVSGATAINNALHLPEDWLSNGRRYWRLRYQHGRRLRSIRFLLFGLELDSCR